jgi:hypothetical protein
MEVGPPGSPCRRRSQSAAVSCRSRAGVGSDCGKGSLTASQLCNEKTNVCEPLLTHRKISRDGIETRAGLRPWDKGAPSWRASARERSACGPGGVRCRGGVSSLQALARNRRTCRLDTDDQIHEVTLPRWSLRGRTPRGQDHAGKSTDARHRGGPTRSSDEGSVMELERRGRAGQVTQMSTLWRRN